MPRTKLSPPKTAKNLRLELDTVARISELCVLTHRTDGQVVDEAVEKLYLKLKAEAASLGDLSVFVSPNPEA